MVPVGNLVELREVKRWLRDLREQHGYTQLEVAEMVGVDTRTIMNGENVKHGLPHGIHMVRWLRALGVVSDAPVDLGVHGPDRRDALREQQIAVQTALVEAVEANTRRLDALEALLLRATPNSGA